MRLGVAGRTLVLRSATPLAALEPPREYTSFLGRRGSDIVLDVACAAGPRLVPERRVFASGSTWEAFRDGRGLVYTFRTRGPRTPPDRILRVDRRVRRGTLFIPDPALAARPGFALAYPLDDLLFQHHLAHRGELVVHGAGLLEDGQVVVLAGASGAGKTTSVRLWRRHRPRARVLSDDRLVLRKRGGRWWAFGTPWHGEGRFQDPSGGPLGALVFLRQASRTAVRAVGPAEGCARLCGLTFPPRWDAAAVDRVLLACTRLARDVPLWELGFRPDRSAVDAVRERVGA
jgi:hypothetical protein